MLELTNILSNKANLAVILFLETSILAAISAILNKYGSNKVQGFKGEKN